MVYSEFHFLFAETQNKHSPPGAASDGIVGKEPIGRSIWLV